jgi:natural product precursor
MKNLMNFSNSALTKSEMKNVKGGCGLKCNGKWSYGWRKSDAKSWLGGASGCTNWCCASC